MKTETHPANPEHGSCSHGKTDPQRNQTVAVAGKYTCPMHPEVISDTPGACPICGMALEPTSPSNVAEDHSELDDLTRRFWIGVVLTLPVFLLAMGEMMPGLKQMSGASGGLLIQFALSTPVVLWAGWPFLKKAWSSVAHRSPNMFTLISLGTSAA